jgi:hypothetical protein
MNNTLNLKYKIVSIEDNWMFCNIYKNASTSIYQSFLNNDMSNSSDQFEKIKKNYKFCSLELLSKEEIFTFLNSNSYKFMYLRNPVERFLSCFINKIIVYPQKNIINSPSYNFLQKYTLSNNFKKDFSNFLAYTISLEEKMHEQHWWSQHTISNYNTIKYSEVVDYRIINSHWNDLSNKYEHISPLRNKMNKSKDHDFLSIVLDNKRLKNKIKEYYIKDYKIAEKWNIGWEY